MRFGLRLQVILLLAGVLAVFVLPLYLATVAYTETAHRAGLHQQASDLLHTIVRGLEETPPSRLTEPVFAERELRRFLTERVPRLRLQTHDHDLESAYDERATTALPTNGMWVHEQLRGGSRLHAFVATPPSAFQRLNPLLVLYMVVSSVALLGGVYYIVTYLIIRPLDRVSLAARNVMSAEHDLSLPSASSLEFNDLHSSLRTMTARLRQDEALQRQKVAEVQAAQEELKRAQAQVDLKGPRASRHNEIEELLHE